MGRFWKDRPGPRIRIRVAGQSEIVDLPVEFLTKGDVFNWQYIQYVISCLVVEDGNLDTDMNVQPIPNSVYNYVRTNGQGFTWASLDYLPDIDDYDIEEDAFINEVIKKHGGRCFIHGVQGTIRPVQIIPDGRQDLLRKHSKDPITTTKHYRNFACLHLGAASSFYYFFCGVYLLEDGTALFHLFCPTFKTDPEIAVHGKPTPFSPKAPNIANFDAGIMSLHYKQCIIAEFSPLSSSLGLAYS